jgi:hypothetical protein
MSSTPETIAAGTWREWFEPGDFFRLLSTTAPVSVEFYSNGKKTVELQSIEAGYAEYFRGEDGKLPFDRVRIYSATTQTVQFVTRQGSDVRYDRGASSVTGTVALDAATLASLEQINVRPEGPSGSWSSLAAVTINNPLTVFAPGLNTNGALLLSADMSWSDSANSPTQTFLSKSGAAPTAVNDGSVLLASNIAISASGNYSGGGRLPAAQFINAGEGLYFISGNSMGTSATNFRACRYKLL